MEVEEEYFNKIKNKAIEDYNREKEIYNPYFKQKIILNSDGFHHLQFSTRKEGNKKEQLLKFSLLEEAIQIIKASGTIQEYRPPLLTPVGKRNSHGEIKMKEVEYWAMIAIIGKRQLKVRVVLKRIGNGNIVFWSVMPFSKIKKGKQKNVFLEEKEQN